MDPSEDCCYQAREVLQILEHWRDEEYINSTVKIAYGRLEILLQSCKESSVRYLRTCEEIT